MSCTKGKNMLKYVLYAVLLLIVAGVVAGGVHLWRVANEIRPKCRVMPNLRANLCRIWARFLSFIIRFPGNTRDIAARIQKQAAADVHEIKLQTPLSPGLACITPYGNSIRGKRCRR